MFRINNQESQLDRKRMYDTPDFKKGRYKSSYRIPYEDAIRDANVGPLANNTLLRRNAEPPFSGKNFSSVALYDPRVNLNESAIIAEGVGASGDPGQSNLGGHAERRAYINALENAHNKFYPGTTAGLNDNSIDLSDSRNVVNQFPNFRDIANRVPLVRLYSEREGCNYPTAQNCVDFSNGLFPDNEYVPELGDFRESYSYHSVPIMKRLDGDTELFRQARDADLVPNYQRITNYTHPQIQPGYYDYVLGSPAIRRPMKSMYDHKNNYRDDR